LLKAPLEVQQADDLAHMSAGLRRVFPMNGLYREGWGDEIRLRVIGANLVSLEYIGRGNGNRLNHSPKRAQAWLDERGFEKVSW
jgi:hypothetical protein